MGGTRSFGAGGDDAFLLKYGADGTLLWQRTYGTAPDDLNSGEEAGIGVAVAPDNSGVLVVGNYRDGNIFLAKFSPAGLLLWDLTWGGNEEGASAIAIAADGTIYVTGITSSFDVGQGDAFLLSFTLGRHTQLAADVGRRVLRRRARCGGRHRWQHLHLRRDDRSPPTPPSW